MAPVRIFSCFLVCWLILSGQTFAGYINIAKSKTTYMSGGSGGTRKEKAVNGDTDGTAYGKCIITGSGLPNTWWEVDLGKTYYILYVKIYFRIDFTARRNGIHVYAHADKQYTSENLCGKLTSAIGGSDIDNITSINCNTDARYITIFQGTDNGKDAGNSMDFCEVEVYTCASRYYGSGCTHECSSRNCAGSQSCDKAYGQCADGCLAGWQGIDCTQACTTDYNYGSGCIHICSSRQCYGSSSCDKVSGQCVDGCLAGWLKTDCTQACNTGYYGSGCSQFCSSRKCSGSESCDNVYGSCVEGCLPGWKGTDCRQACSSGYYGSWCTLQCSSRKCSGSQSCDKEYGKCVDGCLAGWQKTDCSQVCDSSRYGQGCSQLCSNRKCHGSKYCPNTNGNCNDGCLQGSKGTDCTEECQLGVNYGYNCRESCEDRMCAVSTSTCDIQYGTCDGGCQPGWETPDCIQSCRNEKYGPNCSKTCSERNCKWPSSCNNTNGMCDNGCSTGWQGIDCTECDDTYGLACNLPCSLRKCKDSASSCDPQTGVCVGGCEPGYTNSTCTEQCHEGQYGYECKEECSSRKCHGNDMTCAVETGKCVQGCKAGWEGESCITGCSEGKYGMNCNSTCGSCKSSPCDGISGNCIDGCVDGFAGHLCMQRIAAPPPQTGMIAGVAVTAIVVIIVAVVVAVIFIRRRRISKNQATDTEESKKSKTKRMISKGKKDDQDANVYVNVAMETRPTPEGTDVLEETKKVEASTKPVKTASKALDASSVKLNIDSLAQEVDEEENGEEEPRSVYCNVSDYNMPNGGIALSELPAIVEQIRSQPGGFETEYKKLSSDFSSSYSESQIPENKNKNRFVGYYPYDNNRVTLTMLPDVSNSDYINASYLDAYAEKNYFIAAQAPNKRTVPDFWRMMWEKECGHIIMLTRLVELGKNKCEAYWSDTKEEHIGQFKVALTEKEERSDFIYRKFCVTHKKSGQSKTFQQFHFMTWPDHGVPNVHDFLQFMWTVRKTKPTLPGPVLVHCSAGIGRTGTYIALDILLDEMEATGHVDIRKAIRHMRDQRKGVVQTEKQYEMIFVGLIELSDLGNTTLNNVDFQHEYAKQKGSMLMGKKTVDQLAEEVVTLNDTPYEDSVDKYKVWAGGRHNFFAMQPPSKMLKQGYLLAMHQKASEESIWKLLIDNDSYTIITLSAKTDVNLVPQAKKQLTHGKTRITTLRQASVIHEITERTLQVETKGDPEKREIHHYCMHGWTPTIDSATLISCLTTLTEKIQEQQENKTPHPVTVVYSESEAKNAITLCITNNIMTGITQDKEVEIFNNVRRFQAVLADVKLTKDDFAFFCNVAFVNLEASTLYANCPSTSN